MNWIEWAREMHDINPNFVKFDDSMDVFYVGERDGLEWDCYFLLSPSNPTFLEYAIREQIERRQLLWEIGHQWHFQIHDGIVAEGYLARILKDVTTEWEATGDTPLEALAKAYSEAVKHES